MIYPLPKTFTPEQIITAPVYLYIPEYSFEIAADWRDEQPTLNLQPSSSRFTLGGVIDLQIQNTIGGRVPGIVISPQEMLSSNFGNEAGIIITSFSENGPTLAQILAQLNSSRVQICKILFQVISGPGDMLRNFQLLIEETDSFGGMQTRAVNLRPDPFRFQTDICEIDTIFNFGPDTRLRFTLPGNTTLRLSLYPINHRQNLISNLVEDFADRHGLNEGNERFQGVDGFNNFDGSSQMPFFTPEQQAARQVRREQKIMARQEKKASKIEMKAQRMEQRAQALRQRRGNI